MIKRSAIFGCLTAVFLFLWQPAVFAQANSWTNSASGKWEDPYWSLGVLPGTNQAGVIFTNEGVKTLTIDSNTAQKFPDTLTVNSITISAPTNSFNTLVVTNAGLTTLFDFSQSSNSAVKLYSSSLSAEQLLLAGNFTENDSQISTDFRGDNFYLCLNGPGVFNMTNSLLSCLDEYLGGTFPGTFNQQGGTNCTREVYLQNSGAYNLFDGELGTPTNAPTIYFQGISKFNQFGGNISPSLVWLSGMCGYHLAGGNFSCSNLDIPYNPYNQAINDAYFWQSGGTNITGQIALGISGGPGSYTLSGGVLVSGSLILSAYWGFNPAAGPFGSGFVQSGGFHTNRAIQISGGSGEYYDIHPSVYALSNGILETPSISLGMGVFDQSGGTNLANTISLGSGSVYSLSGGLLFAQNIEVTGNGPPPPYFGVGPTYIQQSGGTNLISGTLSVTSFAHYDMRDGQIIAQNASLGSSGFYHYGGTINVRGLLELTNGNWHEQSGGGEFGQLQLVGGTNSLSFSNNSCIVQFYDSSGVLWSNTAGLIVSNWCGSLYGGGNQQIIFGSNSAALTPQQLSEIQFQNPAGLPSGNYPARILSTGEIVPDTGAPLPPRMSLTCGSTNGSMQLTLGGDIGQNYDIEVSTDLVNWIWWTNEFNSNGTVYLPNCEATNFQRFYRARSVPR